MTDWKDRLEAGYKAFRVGNYKTHKGLYEDLGTHGQTPKVMVISCADSRVDPSDIFNASPGDLFVLRNVANIVPPFDKTGGDQSVAAAIEYAVKVIKIDAIVVMGHESCGGIKGCLDGMGHDPEAGHIGQWVSLINEPRDRLLARGIPASDLQFEMELEGIRHSLSNLMSFPFVKTAVERGDLSLQGAYFSIVNARLMLSDDQGHFSQIAY